MADALHLSIPAQGLPNGDATLQHATYPGMQPYPGVGTYSYSRIIHIHTQTFRYRFKSSCFIQCTTIICPMLFVVRWNGCSNETYQINVIFKSM